MKSPKRHDLLLQAMALLPPKPVHLLGDGPQRSTLEQQASALSLPHVHWHGDVHNVAEQLAQHPELLDLLLDLSRAQAGWPTMTREQALDGLAATRALRASEKDED